MGCYASCARQSPPRISPLRRISYVGLNYRFSTVEQEDIEQLLACAYCMARDSDRGDGIADSEGKAISMSDACASLFSLVYRLHHRVVTVTCRLLGDKMGYLVFVPDKHYKTKAMAELLLVASTPKNSPHMGIALAAFRACARDRGFEITEKLSAKQEATVADLFSRAGIYMDLYHDMATRYCQRYEAAAPTIAVSPRAVSGSGSTDSPSSATRVLCKAECPIGSPYLTVTLEPPPSTSPPETPQTPATERKAWIEKRKELNFN